MKKKVEKFVVSTLTVLAIASGILISDVCVTKAYANDAKFIAGGDFMNDNPQTAEEQYQEMLSNPDYSSEVCQKFYNKVFLSNNTRSSRSITMKVLGVPYCEQETDYYCGPATAKQTVTYLTGSAESQSDIWQDIKDDDVEATNGTKLRNYINSKQNENIYSLKNPSSASQMSEDIFYDLNLGIPVILWVKVTEGGNWLYTTSGGHFMNASGINTGGSLIEVTDPYIGWIDGHNYVAGKYWITSQEAYSATKARDIGYYW